MCVKSTIMSDEMLAFLDQLITMPSISADPERANDSKQTAEFIYEKYNELGFEISIIPNEVEGKNPLIMGKLGNDENKKTLLFYSHYDVQPASIEDGWDTEPFDMTEKEDGYVYGRGTNDDKGPITATYFAIKHLQEEGELPINIAILYEGEEESSSGGFEETVTANREFYGEVDGIMVLDTSWFSDERPSVDYGFRGIAYMSINITGPKKDQHSGLVGGSIHEPMTDLVHILSNLIAPDGKVLIENFYEDVMPLEEKEEVLYEDINFNLDEYHEYLGRAMTLKDDPKETLMDMWRNPSLSIHGIEGAFSGPGAKTVVPGTVKGKVSMRLVPDQEPEDIAELFKRYVETIFDDLESPNELEIQTLGTGNWWFGNIDNFLFEAATTAIEDYWEMTPNYARSGGSIPIIPFMENEFDAPAIGVGVGQASDGAHSQNERIRIKNLVGAKYVLAETMKEIGSN